MLAEAGAEVIKIERPGGGDDMRAYEPKIAGESILFAMLQRGKESLTLDLKDPADNARARELAVKADIIIDQFRPGVMARLGLDYETISAANPKVVYCSITGYGQTGPKAQKAAHDLNYVSDMGLLSLLADKEGAPVLPHLLLADIGGGAYPAFINILLALRERDLTGHGRHLDVAMSEMVGPFLTHVLASTAAGLGREPNSEITTGGTVRYGIYRTRDDRFIAAAPLEEKFWLNFTSILGLGIDADRAAVTHAIAARESGELMEALSSRDTCCTLVMTVADAMDDPHNRARGIFARTVDVGGEEVSALPLPLVEAYRDPEKKGRAPKLK